MSDPRSLARCCAVRVQQHTAVVLLLALLLALVPAAPTFAQSPEPTAVETPTLPLRVERTALTVPAVVSSAPAPSSFAPSFLSGPATIRSIAVKTSVPASAVPNILTLEYVLRLPDGSVARAISRAGTAVGDQVIYSALLQMATEVAAAPDSVWTLEIVGPVPAPVATAATLLVEYATRAPKDEPLAAASTSGPRAVLSPVPLLRPAAIVSADASTVRPASWQELLYEDFETTWPGAWHVIDNSGDGYERGWGPSSLRPYTGSYAVWPAAAGANGLDPAYNLYPENLDSWLVIGPYDLSTALAAQLSFQLWQWVESGYDYSFVGFSTDGSLFTGENLYDSADWTAKIFDLGAWLGEPEVWLGINFTSDSSISDLGAWVDDIVLSVDLTPPPSCLRALDLALVFDGSGSISSTDFETMKTFGRELVGSFEIGPSAATVGMVQFSSEGVGRVEIELSDSRIDVNNAIEAMVQLGGATDIQEGIALGASMLQSRGRAGVPKVMILLTDGEHNEVGDPAAEAAAAKSQGTLIFGVAVGPGPDIAQINAIASDPDATYVYTVTDFNSLASIVAVLSENTCAVPDLSEPLVFIPGIGGSQLKQAGKLWPLWPNFLEPDLALEAVIGPLATIPSAMLDRMTGAAEKLALPPQPGVQIIAPDIIRKAFGVADTYAGLIDYLTGTAGYVEYQFNEAVLPGKGCLTASGPTPTLFVFPYDWRKSNAESAALLANYINDCVRAYHPDKNVNILAHSMGGLVARRYVLDQAAAGLQAPVSKIITLGTPWLGAPKAVRILETGEFFLAANLLMIRQSKLRELAATWPGAHELIPGPQYFAMVSADGATAARYGPHLQNVGGSWLPSNFASFRSYYNSRYAAAPVTTTELFHSVAGQDVFSDVPTNIEYHHVIGITRGAETIGQVRVDDIPWCMPIVGCFGRHEISYTWTRGDETVPLISANRSLTAVTTQDNNVFYHHLISGSGSGADSAEHGELVKNAQVRSLINEILRGQSTSAVAVAADASIPPAEPMVYVSVHGGGHAQVTDNAGNMTGVRTDGIVVDTVPGAGYSTLGADGFAIMVPAEGSFVLDFQSGAEPLHIELTTGTDEAVFERIRYLDTVLPANRKARVTIVDGVASNLLYDANGDGAIESQVAPTVRVSGNAASDETDPTLAVQLARHYNWIRVTFAAADAGGAPRVTYAVNGVVATAAANATVQFHLTASSTLQVFAQDAAGNRSTMQEFALQFVPEPVYLPTVRR